MSIFEAMWRSLPRLTATTSTQVCLVVKSFSVQSSCTLDGLNYGRRRRTFAPHQWNQDTTRRTLSTQNSRETLDRVSRRRNFRIMNLGQKRNWGAISTLYWQERKDLNVVNLVTLLYQLSTVKGLDFKTERMEKLLLDAATKIQENMNGGDSIDHRQLKNIQKALNEMDVSDEVVERWKTILAGTQQNGVPASILAAKEINHQLLEFGKNKDWERIIETYDKEKDNFNDINYATALTQLAKCSNPCKDDQRLNELLADISKQISVNHTWEARGMVNMLHSVAKMKLESADARYLVSSILRRDNLLRITEFGNAQDISNLAWSCATLNVSASDLPQAMNEQAERLVETGSSQAIANTAWACATLGIKCPQLFAAIDKDTSKFIKAASTQHIANTAWACATLGIECPNFFNAVEDRATELVLHGKTQEIANTAWAFATLGCRGYGLFSAIDSNADDFVEKAKSQEMANTAWASATLGIQSPSLFQKIDQKAHRFINGGDVQAIANTAWAFATLDVACPSLLYIIDKNSKRLVDSGTTQEIGNLAWSVVKLGQDSPMIFAAIEKRLGWFFQNGTTQEISNVIWAFGQISLYSPAVRRKIDSQASAILFSSERNDDINTQSAANTSIALAQLDHISTSFFDLLCHNMDNVIKNGSELHIANICYAFAILDLALEYEGAFRKLWDCAILLDPASIDHGMGIQLLQTYVMVSQIMDIPPPNNIHQYPQSIPLATVRSKAQRMMSKLLNEIDFIHEMEVSPFPEDSTLPSGLLALDAASKEKKIAIEFNGPSHFLREVRTGMFLNNMKNGPTKAKRRLLERLGWRVVDIDYFDWAQMKTKSARKQLLVEKLRTAMPPN